MRPSRSPSMMRWWSRSLDGQAAAVGLLGLHRLDVGEHLEQLLQRVVAVSARRSQTRSRQTSRCSSGSRLSGTILPAWTIAESSPACDALVEEHAVEGVAGGRVEAEADVGHAERGVRAGDLGLDPPDRLDRVDRVAAQVVVAGRQRERERVEDQVARRQAVALDGDLVDAVGDLHLPLDVAGLAALVDEQADDRRAVLAGERHHPVEAAAGQLAVLEVGRVEDRPATDVLQAGLEHRRLGGVEHERHAGLGGEALGDLVHVDGAVAADVVDADVEHVGALADLLVGHLRARVPVAGEHRVAERLRAVGVGALADDQEAEVLLDRAPGCRSTTRSARTPACGAAGSRSRTASTTWRRCSGVVPQQPPTTRDAELGDVAAVELGELLGREVVVGAAVDDARQAGVGQHADRQRRVLAEVAQVLLHLGRAGGAVDAEHVGPHRGDRRRARRRSRCRRASGRWSPSSPAPAAAPARPAVGHRPPAADHRRLDLQQVHARLDEEQVDAAVEQPGGLLLVGVAQLGEA